jgi:ABC-2 type transport system ATP-binding protein
MGSWALDEVVSGEMETRYFQTREEANAHIEGQQGSFSLRRVNLEDVFIATTGKRVQQ